MRHRGSHAVVIGVLLGGLAAGAAIEAASPLRSAAAPGACELLAAEEIRAVQKTPLQQRKPGEAKRKALRFSQCFFATSDFVRSISLTLITGDGAGSTPNAVRDYWETTFHAGKGREDAGRDEGEEEDDSRPRSIQGAGEEAFWTGDARAGALYVFSGRAILRISVGGVTDGKERLRRSKALARAALGRLGTIR